MGEFNFTRLETVIYGPGKVEMAGRELTRRGAKRTLIVTTKTLGRSKLLDQLKSPLGSAMAGVFSATSQHVPSKTVEALIAEARRVNADSFLSFGGGTPIDSAKAAAMGLLGGQTPRGIDPHSQAAAPEVRGDVVHVAVPTTLSAAEFTPFAGVTDEVTHEKSGVGDPRLQPQVVILDPALTGETPAWLWAGTGIRALDHAVEGAYSSRHNLLSDAMASRAIALIRAHLKPSLQTQGEEELHHRGQCQLAAWFSIFGAINTRFGISHALGHQIGPAWDVPHGFTSCIMLPHVMRFMAEAAPERFAPIAEGFELSFANPRLAALECAGRAAKFIAEFEVPTRLRDVGVPQAELSRVASAVLHEVQRARTVGREIIAADLLSLLEAAY
jgi:maleylacetate reductase